MMDSNRIARLMSECVPDIEWSCAEAAGAMAGILANLQFQLSEEDLHYLISIGGVLFREGLREFECARQADHVIKKARNLPM